MLRDPADDRRSSRPRSWDVSHRVARAESCVLRLRPDSTESRQNYSAETARYAHRPATARTRKFPRGADRRAESNVRPTTVEGAAFREPALPSPVRFSRECRGLARRGTRKKECAHRTHPRRRADLASCCLPSAPLHGRRRVLQRPHHPPFRRGLNWDRLPDGPLAPAQAVPVVARLADSLAALREKKCLCTGPSSPAFARLSA